MKKDYILDLVLRDISINMDAQIASLKAENEELRQVRSQMPDVDKWEQYLSMKPKTAEGRLYDNSCRLVTDEYDRMAAEG